MEKIRVLSLLLLCVALFPVCKAEEGMEEQDRMVSVEKRGLEECGANQDCFKGVKCKCKEGSDCFQDQNESMIKRRTGTAKMRCTAEPPMCGNMKDSRCAYGVIKKQPHCKCQEGQECDGKGRCV